MTNLEASEKLLQVRQWITEALVQTDETKAVVEAIGYAIEKLITNETEKAYQQGRASAIREIENKMYAQCFETDNLEDMQKWDGGNWIRYKLFENVMEQIKEQKND